MERRDENGDKWEAEPWQYKRGKSERNNRCMAEREKERSYNNGKSDRQTDLKASKTNLSKSMLKDDTNGKKKLKLR